MPVLLAGGFRRPRPRLGPSPGGSRRAFYPPRRPASGFVNAHTHASMTLFRGLADDLALGTWLEERLRPGEARFVDEGFVRAGTRLVAAERLRDGTPCFNDMCFFSDVAGEVAREAGLRAVPGLTNTTEADRTRNFRPPSGARGGGATS